MLPTNHPAAEICHEVQRQTLQIALLVRSALRLARGSAFQDLPQILSGSVREGETINVIQSYRKGEIAGLAVPRHSVEILNKGHSLRIDLEAAGHLQAYLDGAYILSTAWRLPENAEEFRKTLLAISSPLALMEEILRMNDANNGTLLQMVPDRSRQLEWDIDRPATAGGCVEDSSRIAVLLQLAC